MSKPDFMSKGKKDDDDKEEKDSGRPNFMKSAKKKADEAVESASEAVGKPNFMKAAKEKAEETVEAVADKAKVGRPDFMKKAIDQVEESAQEAIEEVASAAEEYTVVSGDNLSFISKKFYGTADHWKKIYEANKETIGDNPNLIRVGQVLTIPTLDE